MALEGERRPDRVFSSDVELCYCCGAESIGIVSKWSVLYSDPCRQRVVGLNHAAGRSEIPIGRHSVIHGVLATGDELFDPEEAMGLDVAGARTRGIRDVRHPGRNPLGVRRPRAGRRGSAGSRTPRVKFGGR